MSNVIRIEGRFDEKMTSYVKGSLKKIPIEEKSVTFIINSHGGNMGALKKLKGYMYFMSKYRKCKIIGQLIYGESAGLLFFLNCEERQVAPGSIGIIHLPVANETIPASLLSKKIKETIDFIKRRTKNMTTSQIKKLEHMPLGPKEMISLGIANKKNRTLFITTEAVS